MQQKRNWAGEKIGSDLPRGLIQLAGEIYVKTQGFLKSNNLPDWIAFGSAARKIMQTLNEFTTKDSMSSMKD